MTDLNYVKELEKRIDTLESLLSGECVTAFSILDAAKLRVVKMMFYRNDFTKNYSITIQDKGIRVGFLFGGEEDYSFTIPWKHCDNELSISKYLDEVNKRFEDIDKNESDECFDRL